MRGELEAIQDLYDRGQFLRAFELSEKLGPLRQWRGTTARVLAGRLANALGAPRLASALHDRAVREAPDDPTAQFYGWLALWARSGPYAALRGHLARGRPPRGPRKIEAYWYAAVGHLYALFRDFERAAQHLDVAESLAPESPWVCVDRAALLERQDRREEAVAVARRALELRDWYSPAVVCLARLYGDLNRHAEAQTLLQAATQHNESGAIWAHLALLQVHARQGGAARESVARAKAAYRLCEEAVAKQLAAVDSDAAYVSGDRAAAIELARVSESPFYVALADRLEKAPASARCVRLAVPFVRQHDVTCVPATLTMLCRFWGLEVDHLEVAEEICFSGTPHHVKRRWATSQGLVVRDFTLTWEAVVALVDAGFPFALATVEADSSHVQAIVGYDEARRTLLVHDPGQATETEMAFDQLVERYAAHGPEASVFVPVSEAQRLATIALVDIELHDQMHELRAALDEHRRADAGACVAQLTALAPEHRLTWIAQYYLARYDGQLTESLALVDRLLERYPRDGQLLLFRYALLTEIRPRGERLAWLAEICARPDSDSALWQRYGSELRREARTYAEADRWLRQAIRRRPAYPPAWHALAGLRWSQGCRAEATEFYRIGTCLEPTSQYLVDSYFKACRYTGEADRALALLRERFERDGHRSEMPGCALFEALEAVGRVSEGLEVLDRAVAQRADDGELLLYAAQARLRVGDVGAVEALLERAAGRCRQTAWLAARAELVECRGTSQQMLAAWREVSVRDESHQDARAAIARLLALDSARRAPLAYLDRLARARPDDFALACLHVEWLQRLAPRRHERALQAIVARFPELLWARRELSHWCVEHQQPEGAIAWAWSALEIDPRDAVSHGFLGAAFAAAGLTDAAEQSYREALRLDVDYSFAADQLFRLHDAEEWRRAVLADLRRAISKQTVFGESLSTYQRLAVDVLPPEEVLIELRTDLAIWPDAWQAWLAVGKQLEVLEQVDAAIAHLRGATERFPCYGAIWFELARLEAKRGDAAAEREAIEQACRVAPRSPRLLRALGWRLQQDGELRRACEILLRTVALDPFDGVHCGYAADALWQAERRDEARCYILRAIEVQPNYSWAWRRLVDWFSTPDQRERAIAFARRVARRHRHEEEAWQTLAELLSDAERPDDARAAVAEGIRHNPRAAGLYDILARLWVEADRLDEALAICQADVWEGQLPVNLRGRIAWIHARQGDQPRAIEEMRAVVADAPEYFWGWNRLAEWYFDNGAREPFLEAARKLVELEPDYAVSHGNLAAALLRIHRDASFDEAVERLDRLEEAKQALLYAAQLDPDYVYAHAELFDLSIAEGDCSGAAQSLGHLERIDATEPTTISRKVQLCAARGDLTTGGAALMQLLKQPLPYAWPLETALAALEELPHGRVICEGLLGAAASQEAEPPEQVVRGWIGLCQRTHGWGTCVRRLRRWRGSEAAYKTAADELLILMGKNSVATLLRWFVWRNRRRLAADNHLWARVGWALINHRRNHAACRWLADWQSRPDLDSWPLLLAAIALYAEGRADEAALANRRALDRPRDEFSARHAALLAGEELVAGRTAAARALLPPLDELRGHDYYDAVARLVGAALQIAEEFAAGTRTSPTATRRRLAIAVCEAPAEFGRDQPFDLLWHRLLGRIATDQGHGWLAIASRLRVGLLRVDIALRR